MATSEEIRSALDPFWAASGSTPTPSLTASGADDDCSAFRTALAASASCGAVVAAVAELTGQPAPTIDQSLALANFTTYVTVDGRPLPKWASLSGNYRTGDDRFVQLHCNFPHHAAGTAARLGVPEDRAEFERAISCWDALDLETALIADGMIGAVSRTLDEWAEHPHAVATAGLPLIDVRPLGGGEPEQLAQGGSRPLGSVRVLDCSRVLAGPAAGQTLASLGADVMRVGAEHLPHVEICVVATGTGKRNVFLDLRQSGARETFVDLVRDADVILDAFRPGALGQYGFGPNEIAAISPRTNLVRICAFDWVGPWAGRRGYDSIVQTTTGIAMAGAEMSGNETPTPLPVQALDYATGFFAAAAAIRAVHRTRTLGGSTDSRLSLLRTRNWLVSLGGPKKFTPGSISPTPQQLQKIDSDFGVIELVRPFIGQWTHGPRHLGTSAASWL